MKLLAAVDLSKASSYIIEAVHRVAMATDAEVHVLFAEPPLPSALGPAISPAPEPRALAEGQQVQEETLDRLVEQLTEAGVNATALFRHGIPAKVVLEEAERLDVELIVLGSHGHGLLFDAIVGSVSAEVLRKSPVPVLVVPVRGK